MERGFHVKGDKSLFISGVDADRSYEELWQASMGGIGRVEDCGVCQ